MDCDLVWEDINTNLIAIWVSSAINQIVWLDGWWFGWIYIDTKRLRPITISEIIAIALCHQRALTHHQTFLYYIVTKRDDHLQVSKQITLVQFSPAVLVI